jgi:hypothetical protein
LVTDFPCGDQQVDNLPKSLTSLTFGEYFDQQVDNLPKTLTSLIFGYNFENPTNNLPSGFWFTKIIAIINFNYFQQPTI